MKCIWEKSNKNLLVVQSGVAPADGVASVWSGGADAGRARGAGAGRPSRPCRPSPARARPCRHPATDPSPPWTTHPPTIHQHSTLAHLQPTIRTHPVAETVLLQLLRSLNGRDILVWARRPRIHYRSIKTSVICFFVTTFMTSSRDKECRKRTLDVSTNYTIFAYEWLTTLWSA